MLLTRTVAPAALLTEAEVKAHLRVDHVYEDTFLTLIRTVACEFLDGRDAYLNRAVCTQTWRWYLPEFSYGDELHFPLPPLQSVTSVKYRDVDDVEQTFSADNYRVHANAHVGYIKLKDAASWPATAVRDDAVTVEFVAGYGDATAVPFAIKAAALLMVGRLYANRGDADETKANALAITETEKRLLAPYRIQEFVTSNEQYWRKAGTYPHR